MGWPPGGYCGSVSDDRAWPFGESAGSGSAETASQPTQGQQDSAAGDPAPRTSYPGGPPPAPQGPALAWDAPEGQGRPVPPGHPTEPLPPFGEPQYPPPSMSGNPPYPAGAAAPPPTRGRGVGAAVFAGLLAGIVGGAGTFWALDAVSGANGGAPVELPQAGVVDSPPADGSVAAVAQTVLPTVVSMRVSGSGSEASGSGFVIRSDGYILTNNHVIADAADGGRIEVTLHDGRALAGELVGRNISYDLAVVRIDATGLPTSSLGNSENVAVGDTAIAIGAPLGLTQTVTQGIISALDRPVTAGGQGEFSYINAIQTDAAINPGNSGGPLLNGAGEVIGVNSAIASIVNSAGEAGSIGLGFAIPINQAKRISEEIIATGASQTPVIGVTLDLSYGGPGARVREATPGGPAAGAGIRGGDIIVAVDGQRVADSTELVVAIRTNAPGDTITLTLDDGEEVTLTLDGTEDL